jgi:hypothetical protein
VVVASAATTWNPADKNADLNLTNSDLTVTEGGAAGSYRSIRSVGSFTSSEKICFEAVIDVNTLNCCLGLMNAADGLNTYVGQGTGGVSIVLSSGLILITGGVGPTYQTSSAGQTVRVAYDGPNAKMWFQTNGGNWNNDVIGNQNPATNTGGLDVSGLAAGPYYAAATLYNQNDALTANFNPSSPPSGFVAI